ncbi:hypothetical protein RchiOBHm_Chr3g0490381 [Rosa chinensis]|uniref:Uncharacterized protein n=1 Tax=Rosa chinensis TaxID=74649 RepID=A0A2P6RG02_ROSCH|nr:hypothetical protein RchiOBHm_Chr3g0490381 [Rosa chinensis]
MEAVSFWCFSCKSFHKFLIGDRLEQKISPASLTWKHKVPAKVKVSRWLVHSWEDEYLRYVSM